MDLNIFWPTLEDRLYLLRLSCCFITVLLVRTLTFVKSSMHMFFFILTSPTRFLGSIALDPDPSPAKRPANATGCMACTSNIHFIFTTKHEFVSKRFPNSSIIRLSKHGDHHWDNNEAKDVNGI